MPYVICEKCNGYYELQKGESLNDFERCTCGGNLSYLESLNIVKRNKSPSNNVNSVDYKSEDPFQDDKKMKLKDFLEISFFILIFCAFEGIIFGLFFGNVVYKILIVIWLFLSIIFFIKYLKDK